MKTSAHRKRQRLVPLVTAFLWLACLVSLLCPQPAPGAPTESVEAFLARYYQAIPKAKSLLDLESWYTPMPPDPKLKSMLEEPELMAFFMEAMKGEPTAVKVISKTVKGDRIYLDVAPAAIPQRFAQASTRPGFSMTGSVIVVADGDKWKVHKDFWSVKSTSKNGSETTSFGRNPPDGADGERGKSEADAAGSVDKSSGDGGAGGTEGAQKN